MEITKDAALAIPSAISVAGYALVHDGIDRGITTREGIGEVFVGRVADLADGWVARRFGLATRPGAFIDAVLDKKATQEILDAVSAEGVVPPVVESAIRSQNQANMGLTALAKLRHPRTELSPTRNGKRSMFFQGMAMGSYALAEAVRDEHPGAARVVRGAGHLMAASGLLYYGPQAKAEYAGRVTG
jgi:phosphatidylglycerophosphate synthase